MNRRRFLQASLAGLGYSHSLFTQLVAAELPADITAMTATTLSTAIASREVSCIEVMQAYLARIERYNSVYNAIVGQVDADQLIAQAKTADQALAQGNYQGWMHGMPHAVKDLTAVKGLIHTSASPIYAQRVAEEDSAMVGRLRASGAIFVGKTNASEFGLGSQSYNPVFGATGSACDPALTAGGSSGGAGSVLGTNMMPVADGSDMMGSLRNPGAFNNVIGFRPSVDGSDMERGLATSGPMGRNTIDTIHLLHTMTGTAMPDYQALPLSGVKIGWLADMDRYLPMEQGILALCEYNLALMEQAGAVIEPVRLGMDPAEIWTAWTTLRHVSRRRMESMYNDPQVKVLMKPELIWEIEQGLNHTDADIQIANELRKKWYMTLDNLFAQYDFLTSPSSQVFPFSKDVHWPHVVAGRQMDTYHRWMEVVIPASLAGLPVINVPVGFDGNKRPMGMQLIGRHSDDQRVLELALSYESLIPYLDYQPPLKAAF